jgi:plasmid stabilization system protein ParE
VDESALLLAPAAALDLAKIWRYILLEKGPTIADRVESVILNRIALLATNPDIGHQRLDITRKPVRFFPVYSYLITPRNQTFADRRNSART